MVRLSTLGVLLVVGCGSPPAAEKTPAPPALPPAAPAVAAAGEPPGDPPADPPADPAPAAGDEPAEGAAGDVAGPMDPAYRFESFPLDDYPLDSYERVVGSKGRVACPEVDTVVYRGDHVRYHKPVRVFVAFRDRLRKFEQVVREVAIEVYGRAPRRIEHFGTYVCRRMRGDYKEFISEHAFANAIDVAAFHFGGASRAERAAAPAGLRGSFSVTVDHHWHGDRGKAAVHARFLHLLIERLAARADIFRVMLGPGYPNHDNHFHFDASVFRLIDMEGYGR